MSSTPRRRVLGRWSLRYGQQPQRGMTMRRRKHLMPLTLDSLRTHMAPGRSYTSVMLACIFDGSPAAIAGMLETLSAAGDIRSHIAYRETRPERRRYWIAPPKRLTPAERGELRGYDLMRFPRLAMASRR